MTILSFYSDKRLLTSFVWEKIQQFLRIDPINMQNMVTQFIKRQQKNPHRVILWNTFLFWLTELDAIQWHIYYDTLFIEIANPSWFTIHSRIEYGSQTMNFIILKPINILWSWNLFWSMYHFDGFGMKAAVFYSF